MLVAAQTTDVHPRLLELPQKEVAFSIVELGLLMEGPEVPPVKFRQCIIEVASGDRKKGQCAVFWGCLQAQGVFSPVPRRRQDYVLWKLTGHTLGNAHGSPGRQAYH